MSVMNCYFMKKQNHYDEFEPVRDITSRMPNDIQDILVIPIRSLKAHAVLIKFGEKLFSGACNSFFIMVSDLS